MFDYVANPSRIPEWGPFCSGVEPQFDDVPERGARFVATLSFGPRTMPKPFPGGSGMPNLFPGGMESLFAPMQQQIGFVVDDIVPGRRIAYSANEISWKTVCDFEPSAGRTIFTVTHSLWSAAGVAMGYWMPAIHPYLESGARRILDGVKRRLEGRQMDPKPRIFFSYRRDSRYVGGRIFDALRSEFGLGTVFRDTDSLIAGRDWDVDIMDTIRGCHVIVIHIDDGWEDQLVERYQKDIPDTLRRELEAGLQKNVPFIPVLTSNEDTIPVADRMRQIETKLRELDTPILADRLAQRRQGQALRADPDFTGDLERLMRSVWYLYRQGRSRESSPSRNVAPY